MKENSLIDTFANRLQKAMNLRNLKASDLSEKTKISKSSISEYLSGKYEAKQNGIYLLSKALNVNEAWLMGLDVPMERIVTEETEDYQLKNNIYMLPVYGRISAGIPNWAEECIEGKLPIDPNLMNIINPEECFFLKVNGESMNKIIKNGAYALIRKADMVDNGEIAVILVNGFDATLKKFSKQGNLIILEPQSTDETIETQVYDENTEVKIIGKYIGKMEMK